MRRTGVLVIAVAAMLSIASQAQAGYPHDSGDVPGVDSSREVTAGPLTTTTATVSSATTNQMVAAFLSWHWVTGASVYWGDGSTASNGTLTQHGSGVVSVGATHQYTLAGTYAVTTVVAGQSCSIELLSASCAPEQTRLVDSRIVVIAPVTGAPRINASVGATLHDVRVATVKPFTSPSGVPYVPDSLCSPSSAVIDWGDGTSTPGTLQGDGVVGSHTYDRAGAMTATTTATFSCAVQGFGVSTASVTRSGKTAVSVVDGHVKVVLLDSRGLVGSTTYLDGTVSDPENCPGCTVGVSVRWGDGSAPADADLVERANGGYYVSGAHVYDQAGDYPISITATVRRADGSFVNEVERTGTAHIAPEPPVT